MAAQDKTVRITIAVDEASAEKAKQAIIGIKTEVDRLVDSVKALGGFFGSLKVGTQAGQPGTSPGVQAQHVPGGGGAGGGGISQVLSFGAVQGGKEIADVTQKVGAHVKTMKGHFQSLTEAQDQMVRKSQSIWERFRRMMTGSSTGGGGPGVAAPPGGAGGAAGGAGGGGAAGGGGRGQRGLMASMGQALGVPGWVLGTAGAVGFAAGAAGTLYSAWGEQKAVQNQLALQQPLMPSQVQAQFGDTMGANAVAIRHGDLGRSWAISQVKKTATYNEVQSERYKQHIQEQIKLEAPVGLKEAAETGRLGKIWDSVTSRLGAGVAVAVKHPLDSLKELGASAVDAAGAGIGFNRGTLGIKNQNFLGAVNDVIPADAAKRQMALRDHAADQVRARQELVNNFMRANPQVMTDMNEFYGSALGDQGLARAGGVSGGFRYNKKTKQWRDSLSDFEQGARNMGISGAERAGFEQTMGAQAGRGFFYNGASLLSPQAGGLSNAAQIFGVGAQFNGGGGWGGAQSFMGGIQGKIGRGGLDVTAGVQVANTGMAAMTSGRFQASGGGGVMSALMDAAGGGSTGRDMRNARMVSSGFGAMDQQVLGGGLDPLQKALNYSSAMEVGGHLPWATQKALANMDAATVAEVMRNPNSAQANALKSKGITADLLRDYFKSSNSKTFTRVTSDMLTGSQQQAMASFQAAGGSTSYMKGMIGSLAAAKKMSPGKARNRAMASAQSALDAAESDLATIFEMDRGWDTEKSLGYVKTLMGIEGTSGAVSGRGASRPDSMKTVRGGAIRKGGQFIGDKGTRLANLEHGLDAEGKPLKGADGQLLGGKALSDAIASMTPEAKREDAAAAAASKAAGGGDLNATIDQLGDILRKFVGQLHGSVGGAAGPPG